MGTNCGHVVYDGAEGNGSNCEEEIYYGRHNIYSCKIIVEVFEGQSNFDYGEGRVDQIEENPWDLPIVRPSAAIL